MENWRNLTKSCQKKSLRWRLASFCHTGSPGNDPDPVGAVKRVAADSVRVQAGFETWMTEFLLFIGQRRSSFGLTILLSLWFIMLLSVPHADGTQRLTFKVSWEEILTLREDCN